MFFNILKKVYRFLDSEEKRQAWFVIVLAIIVAFLEALSILSITPFLYAISHLDFIESKSWLSEMYFFSKENIGIDTRGEFLVLLGSSTFVFVVFASLVKLYSLYIVNMFIELRGASLAIKVLSSYLGKSYIEIINNHSSDITKTIISDVDKFIMSLLRPIVLMITNGALLAFVFIFLLFYNFSLSILAILSFVSLYSIYHFSFRGKIEKIGDRLMSSNKDRHLFLSNTIGGIKLIKLTGVEGLHLSLYETAANKFSKSGAAYLFLAQIPNILIELVVFGGLIFFTVSWISLNNSDLFMEEFLPTIGIFAMASIRLKPAFQGVYNGISAITWGAPIIDNIRKSLINNELENYKPVNVDETINFKESLAVANVSFKHNETDLFTLKNINFKINKGDSIGIVGSTGAGKTTLLDIMLGLLSPTSGDILIDGKVIDGSNISIWQESLAYVQQDIFLTNSSIAKNIALDESSKSIDMNKVIKSAKIAQLDDFINNELTEGYNTKIGERGVRLSGGQRQRIGIARAIYLDKSVIFFDEATSALDSKTEKKVISGINSLSNLKTLVIVTHRLSTIKNCNKIIFLDRGEVSSIGSFEELVSTNRIFKDFVKQ